MAGKTFTGIGLEDLLKENPPVPADAAADAVPVNPGEGEDLHSVNSEPTIVDAEKVAEGLLRLRSLQTIHGMPAAPGHGMPVAAAPPAEAPPTLVADMGSSEPTKIGLPAARATAVGRTSDLEPPGRQMVVQPDNLRGTMFGHTVHLPEIHERLEAEEVSTGPIYVPPPQPGAPTTQLVPYQPPPPRMPSFHGVERYPRRPAYSSGAYPSDEQEQRTETIPPLGRRGYARAILVMFMLALAALATLAWMRYRASDADDVRPPPAPPPAPPPPAASAEPPAKAAVPSGTAVAGPSKTAVPADWGDGKPKSAAAPLPRPTPGGSAVRAGAPAEGAQPAAAEPTRPRPPAEAAPTTDRGPAQAVGPDSRRRPGRTDRRRVPAADVPNDPAAATAKGTKKGPASEDDPDATLPPSFAD